MYQQIFLRYCCRRFALMLGSAFSLCLLIFYSSQMLQAQFVSVSPSLAPKPVTVGDTPSKAGLTAADTKDSQEDSAQSAHNIEPEAPVQSETQPEARPGLGISGFSPQDLQNELDSVRQFAATPLRFQSSERRSLNTTPASKQTDEPTAEAAELQPSVASDTPPAGSARDEIQEGIQTGMNGGETLPFIPRNSDLEGSRQLPDSIQTPGKTSKPQIPRPLSAKTQETQSALPSFAVSSAPVSGSQSKPQRGTSTKQINISKTIPMSDSFHLVLHGLIWTYIPSLSHTPHEPEFERELGNLKTSFVFQFPVAGRYLLTFSRQLPSTGELEYYNAEIMVTGEEPSVDAAAGDANFPSQRLQAKPIVPESSAQLSVENEVLAAGSSSSIGMAELDSDMSFRITSQVISDIRTLLQDGELDSAYQTLNNWPARERGDIYDTAARYFADVGMHSEAVDMWRRNIGLEGELHDKALVGIIQALTKGGERDKLLDWLPQFVEQAREQQNNPLEQSLVSAEDFAAVYQILQQLDTAPVQNSTAVSVKPAETPQQVLDFYQAYVELYPDRNSSEILYKMGLLFEKPGEKQDLRKARQLYQDIQTNYPVDIYSQKAAERLNYLNRHFFLVR